MFDKTMVRCLLAVLVVTMVCKTSTAQIYDAVNDFSVANNPNGVWSYGTLSSFTGGAFTLFNQKGTNLDYQGESYWSNGYGYPDFATVQKNGSAGTADFYTIVQPPRCSASTVKA